MSDRVGRWMMGFMRDARGRSVDPTREWPAAAVSALEFDAESGRLNGIPLDAPIPAAVVLGRADGCSGGAEDPELDYRALGLQVQCYEGVITSFRVIVDPARRESDRDRAFQAGELTLRTRGRSLRLTGATTEADLAAGLGPPVETGPVAGDRVHTFTPGRSLIETYHDPATGRLLELTLCLHADESAQAAGGDADP